MGETTKIYLHIMTEDVEKWEQCRNLMRHENKIPKEVKISNRALLQRMMSVYLREL